MVLRTGWLPRPSSMPGLAGKGKPAENPGLTAHCQFNARKEQSLKPLSAATSPQASFLTITTLEDTGKVVQDHI